MSPLSIDKFTETLRFSVEPLRRDEARGVELLSAVMLAWTWGVVLLWPGNTFTSTRAYTYFALLGPEWLWALMALLIALLQAPGRRMRRRVRAMGAVLAATFFLTAALALWLGNPLGTGWTGNAIVGLFNLWAIRKMR